MAAIAFSGISTAALNDSTRMVFRELFTLEAEGPLTALLRPPTERWISGSIFLSGDWSGVLRMDLPVEMAARLAGLWRCQAEPVRTPAEIDDAVGELANTVAGNLKNLAPGIHGMSVPRITSGGQPSADISSQRLQAYYRLLDQELRVSLTQLPPKIKLVVVPKPGQ